MEAQQSKFRFIFNEEWQDVVLSLPRLTYVTSRYGVLGAPASIISILKKEGSQALHWKALGDGIVRVFQNSGPVFVKLGQILASRQDFLPVELCQRLEKLYDHQVPMDAKQVKAIIDQAYPKGTPFRKLDLTPIGVGSVGQVHRAELNDGRPVIVKFIRPGMTRAIERDIQTLRLIFSLTMDLLPLKDQEVSRFILSKSLDDLKAGFKSELNLKKEAKSLQIFRKRLKNHPQIYVPEVYPQWCTRHVLVMEEIKGEPLSAYRERIKSASTGDDEMKSPSSFEIAEAALKEVLTQIFVEGHFHADPHPGNWIIMPDGRLGMIDFGLTSELTNKDRKNISRAVKAFIAKDADELITVLLEFGELPPHFNLDRFKGEVKSAVQRHKEQMKAALTGKYLHLVGQNEEKPQQLEEFVNLLFNIAYRHRIHLPTTSTLLIKTLVTIEGVARSLNPDLNLIAIAVPVVLEAVLPRWMRWAVRLAR